MSEFAHHPLFPLSDDATPYRKLSSDHVDVERFRGEDILTVRPEALGLLAEQAFFDISHFLRPGHLGQLRAILDDDEASDNDRFVAYDLLKNANIAAGGVLPMCQDTGTAIVMGKKGERVWTGSDDEAALAAGIHKTYTERNLRYSNLAPISMYEEVNTGTNLPAQIEIYATEGTEYGFLFIAKGGGSANKFFLFQETPARLNPESMLGFLDEKIRTLGTAACPPYHLAICIGGMSAEFNLKTVKLASTRYLDGLPTRGSEQAHAFRDPEMEEQVLEMTRNTGIGAQFGGKYFCHDVRVIRLPRHGASLPIGLGVSCSADRQALGKITREGVFLERLETNPAQYLPDIDESALGGEVVKIDIDRPMDEISGHARPLPDQDPAVADRLHGGRARRGAREDQVAARRGRGHTLLPARQDGVLRRPGEDARGLCLGLVRPDHRGAHGLLRRAVPEGGRQLRHAGQGQPLGGGHRGLQGVWRLLSRLDRRPRRPARPGTVSPGSTASSIPSSEWRRCGGSRWKDFPAFIVVDDKGNDFFRAL